MYSTRQKIVSGSLILATISLAVVLSSHAQTTSTASPSAGAASSAASMNAERAEIWNSPNMLRAGPGFRITARPQPRSNRVKARST